MFIRQLFTPNRARTIHFIHSNLVAKLSRPCVKPLHCGFQKIMASHYATVTYVTTSGEQEAQNLAKELIENRLAACVSIVNGVQSIYEWQGAIKHDQEYLMIIKSNSTKSVELKNFILTKHSFECPEVVTLRVDTGNESYLKWIDETIQKQSVTHEKE